jgi:hypothetical protein
MAHHASVLRVGAGILSLSIERHKTVHAGYQSCTTSFMKNDVADCGLRLFVQVAVPSSWKSRSHKDECTIDCKKYNLGNDNRTTSINPCWSGVERMYLQHEGRNRSQASSEAQQKNGAYDIDNKSVIGRIVW